MVQQDSALSDSAPAVPAPEPHLHVAGILVHVAPQAAADVRAWIDTLDGARIHGAADGKLVVTVEAPSGVAVLDCLRCIQERQGVVSALLISQHSEPASQIDEEESYGD